MKTSFSTTLQILLIIMCLQTSSTLPIILSIFDPQELLDVPTFDLGGSPNNDNISHAPSQDEYFGAIRNSYDPADFIPIYNEQRGDHNSNSPTDIYITISYWYATPQEISDPIIHEPIDHSPTISPSANSSPIDSPGPSDITTLPQESIEYSSHSSTISCPTEPALSAPAQCMAVAVHDKYDYRTFQDINADQNPGSYSNAGGSEVFETQDYKVTRKYRIEENLEKAYKECQIDYRSFESCVANYNQLNLHRDFLAIASDISKIYIKTEIPSFQPLKTSCVSLLHASAYGMQANNEGKTNLAYALKEWCSEGKDYLWALIEGVEQGCMVLYNEAVNNPVEAGLTLVFPELAFAYHMIPAAYKLLVMCYEDYQAPEFSFRDLRTWPQTAVVLLGIGKAAQECYASYSSQKFKLMKDLISYAVKYAVKRKVAFSINTVYSKALSQSAKVLDKHALFSSHKKIAADPKKFIINARNARRSSKPPAERMGAGHPGTVILKASGHVAPFLRTKEATELANKLGYIKTNFYTKQNRAIYKGELGYISPDVDVHNNGVWKVADEIKELSKQYTRKGTFNASLSYRIKE